MKFSLAFLNSVLLATTALAAPHASKGGLLRRAQRRAAGVRTLEGTTMKAKDSSNAKTKVNAASGNSSDVQYSTNWSGAALTSPPTGQTFNAVSGSFTVPTPSAPSGVSATDGEYSASAWVGIDGNTYSTAILQTGVDFTVSTSGEVSFSAWYEWYPDYAYDFDIEISAGDVINASVSATTTTTGVATIENTTTGKVATITLTSSSALGGENAEWIVEDFEENQSLVAFADFGNLTFKDCIAATSQSSEGVTSATIMDIEDTSGNILTDVSVLSDSSFQVTYTDTTSSTGTSTGSDSGSGSSGSESGSGSSGSGSSGSSGSGGVTVTVTSGSWPTGSSGSGSGPGGNGGGLGNSAFGNSESASLGDLADLGNSDWSFDRPRSRS